MFPVRAAHHPKNNPLCFSPYAGSRCPRAPLLSLRAAAAALAWKELNPVPRLGGALPPRPARPPRTGGSGRGRRASRGSSRPSPAAGCGAKPGCTSRSPVLQISCEEVEGSVRGGVQGLGAGASTTAGLSLFLANTSTLGEADRAKSGDRRIAAAVQGQPVASSLQGSPSRGGQRRCP